MSGMSPDALPHFAEAPHLTNERWVRPSSVAERVKAGKKLRGKLPRAAVATLGSGSRDPLGILTTQNERRLQELIPLRNERMSLSPFTFYRGTAAIMAADLALEPHTELMVPSCGDAHVSNFGFYASAQRRLVFDLNDFDEAAYGPWEWDLKRLVASVVIAGQATSRDERAIRVAVTTSVRAYAIGLRAAMQASPTDRYFAHFDAEASLAGLHRGSRKVLKRAINQAQKRTGERAVKKLTTQDEHGMFSFIEQPPTMYRMDHDFERRIHHFLTRYLESANDDIRQLMRNYVISDVIRRVVGVGSVGTRCSLTLLQDGDEHTLLLQGKEANRSVIEEFGGITQPRELRDRVALHGQGSRVVALQRILQGASDPLLGHLKVDDIDLYVRQFHDMKGGIEAEELEDEPFATYAQACAVLLARAHSQVPVAAVISGYIGGGRVFGESLLTWAYEYAARSQGDYVRFLSAHAGSPGTPPALG